MSILQKQIAFTRAISKLLSFAEQRNYGLTFGDAWDSDGDGGHMDHSLHKQRLALDLNLFLQDPISKEWHWVTNGKDEAWIALGTYWETLHDLARWGGRFKKNDSNHFSFEEGGRM